MRAKRRRKKKSKFNNPVLNLINIFLTNMMVPVCMFDFFQRCECLCLCEREQKLHRVNLHDNRIRCNFFKALTFFCWIWMFNIFFDPHQCLNDNMMMVGQLCVLQCVVLDLIRSFIHFFSKTLDKDLKNEIRKKISLKNEWQTWIKRYNLI